jgi:hypothetical protein
VLSTKARGEAGGCTEAQTGASSVCWVPAGQGRGRTGVHTGAVQGQGSQLVSGLYNGDRMTGCVGNIDITELQG